MALQLDSRVERLSCAADVVARASRLRVDMATTVKEVCRVTDGLRPGVLAELGLAESIRALQCATEDRVRTKVGADLAQLWDLGARCAAGR